MTSSTVRPPGLADVSIVMPVHNAERYLERTFADLAALDPAPHRIVVVLDGCTDRSADILGRWRSRLPPIEVVENGQRQGPGVSRNLGVAEVDSAYVWFCDCDDTWSPNILGALHDAVTTAQADIAVCAASVHVADTGQERSVPQLSLDAVPAGTLTNREALSLLLQGHLSGNLWNKLFRVSLCRDHPFPADGTHEDLQAVLSMLPDCTRVVVVHDRLYTYIQRPRSAMSSGSSYCLGLMTVRAAADQLDPSLVRTRDLDWFRFRWIAVPMVQSALRYPLTSSEELAAFDWAVTTMSLRHVVTAIVRRDLAAAVFAGAVRLGIARVLYGLMRRLRYGRRP